MIIKIWGENPKFLTKLLDLDFKVEVIKNYIICQPGYDEEKQQFFIPEPILDKKFSLFIYCEEKGGATVSGGEATVVCSLSGDRIKPYSTFNPINGVHAMFAAFEAVSTVTAYHKQNEVSIKMHFIERLGDFILLKTAEVWTGLPTQLPKMYSFYELVVAAAKKKADCYNCQDVHYAVL